MERRAFGLRAQAPSSASVLGVPRCAGTAGVLEIPSGATLDCRISPVNIAACHLKCSNASNQVFWRIPVGDQTCTTLADFNGDGTLDVPAGTAVTKQKTDLTINVNSNKTLRGAGRGGTFKGVSLNISSKIEHHRPELVIHGNQPESHRSRRRTDHKHSSSRLGRSL
ncbi:MAG: hypothetical protein QM784_17735 [Polyangiaceae bacterium]